MTILRFTRNTLILLCLLQAAILVTPITRWWVAALRGPWPDCRGDTLILLGGEQTQGGFPGRSTYWRAVYATSLWKEGRFSRILISGGSAPGEPELASAVARFLVSEGVLPAAIQTESASTTTRENAREVRKMLRHEHGAILLMSSDFHMRRASGVFHRTGIDAVPCPAPDAIKQYYDWTERCSLFWRLCQETIKLGYYALRGWI